MLRGEACVGGGFVALQMPPPAKETAGVSCKYGGVFLNKPAVSQRSLSSQSANGSEGSHHLAGGT